MKLIPPTVLCLLALALLVCLPAAQEVRADDEDAPRFTRVEVEEAGELVRDKAVVEALPEGQFFSDGEALVAWWEAMDWAFKDKPDVDFDDSILVIETRDAADPNRVRWGGRLNQDGELEVMGMSTMMGFESSDEVKLVFLVVPREGIEAIARNVQKIDDDGRVTFERVLYPVEED